MHDDHATLDSAVTTIDELVARVSSSADRFQEAGNEAAASDLYDVERSLRAAGRRLALVVRRLDGVDR